MPYLSGSAPGFSVSSTSILVSSSGSKLLGNDNDNAFRLILPSSAIRIRIPIPIPSSLSPQALPCPSVRAGFAVQATPNQLSTDRTGCGVLIQTQLAWSDSLCRPRYIVRSVGKKKKCNKLRLKLSEKGNPRTEKCRFASRNPIPDRLGAATASG